jgi:Fic family protein
MKKPLPPPNLARILSDTPPSGISRIIGLSPLVDGKYLHWNELRHRIPPDGLSHELWWAGLKLARNALRQELPLRDKHDHPLTFTMPEPVLRSLHRIDRDAAGQIRMDLPIATREDRDRYLVSSLIEEAITSSQLEGAATTRHEAKAMLRAGRRPRDRGERMIFNNYQAMQFIRDIRHEPLTPERVFELHRIVTADTLDKADGAGRFRRDGETIDVVDSQHSTILHSPPPAAELPRRLDALCAFANTSADEAPFVHPVVRAILLHYMIGYDHPFVDGNGRTARALFYWSMARQGYWLMEYISISRLLRKAPAQYGRAYLHCESDDNDTTYFILHQLDVIERAIDALHAYLADKLSQQRSAESLLRRADLLNGLLNHRQIALLSHALRHPGHHYTVESHRRSHQIAYQTARTDLLALAELGLTEMNKIGRKFLFTAPAGLHRKIESLAGEKNRGGKETGPLTDRQKTGPAD